VHLSWVGGFGGWWDETDFHETRDTGFLLARLKELWTRVPRYKPLSVGVVLLDLVPAAQHQPDLFDTDTGRRQKLSPLIGSLHLPAIKKAGGPAAGYADVLKAQHDRGREVTEFILAAAGKAG
jgi:hypothetical protein